MRLVVALLSVVALAFAAPAAADPPTSYTAGDVFPDVNPCTGSAMIVTITFAGSFHEHGSRVVDHSRRTITTSDGFAGGGADSFVISGGNVLKGTYNDIMTNAAGDRFRAHGVFVLDLETGVARVDKSVLICLSAK